MRIFLLLFIVTASCNAIAQTPGGNQFENLMWFSKNNADTDSVYHTGKFCLKYIATAQQSVDSFAAAFKNNIFVKNQTMFSKNTSLLFFIKCFPDNNYSFVESDSSSLPNYFFPSIWLQLFDCEKDFIGTWIKQANRMVKNDIQEASKEYIYDWVIYNSKTKKVVAGNFGKSFLKEKEIQFYLKK